MTERTNDRAAGAALMAGALGTVLAMAHHPSGAHSGALGPLVHGAMIALLTMTAWGFLRFELGRGASRPLPLAGLLVYGVSLFGHIGAATINGFVVPALAARGHGAVSHDVFLLAWEANQALARLGVYMTGLAFTFWSVDLVIRERGAWRLAGLLGLAAGLVPAGLLAAGVIRMDLAGAFLVYGVHAAWAALIGLLLVSGRGSDAAG